MGLRLKVQTQSFVTDLKNCLVNNAEKKNDQEEKWHTANVGRKLRSVGNLSSRNSEHNRYPDVTTFHVLHTCPATNYVLWIQSYPHYNGITCPHITPLLRSIHTFPDTIPTSHSTSLFSWTWKMQIILVHRKKYPTFFVMDFARSNLLQGQNLIL